MKEVSAPEAELIEKVLGATIYYKRSTSEMLVIPCNWEEDCKHEEKLCIKCPHSIKRKVKWRN